jgi:hypothetical protein
LGSALPGSRQDLQDDNDDTRNNGWVLGDLIRFNL